MQAGAPDASASASVERFPVRVASPFGPPAPPCRARTSSIATPGAVETRWTPMEVGGRRRPFPAVLECASLVAARPQSRQRHSTASGAGALQRRGAPSQAPTYLPSSLPCRLLLPFPSLLTHRVPLRRLYPPASPSSPPCPLARPHTHHLPCPFVPTPPTPHPYRHHHHHAEPLPMLKLKDFPPTSDFRRVLARHHDDFVAMLGRWGPGCGVLGWGWWTCGERGGSGGSRVRACVCVCVCVRSRCIGEAARPLQRASWRPRLARPAVFSPCVLCGLTLPAAAYLRRPLARHPTPRSCMPAYCHPTHGPLNLATLLPWYTKLPDLGPKGYIAYGRWAPGPFHGSGEEEGWLAGLPACLLARRRRLLAAVSGSRLVVPPPRGPGACAPSPPPAARPLTRPALHAALRCAEQSWALRCTDLT